jgi:hypothetical protein
MECPPELLQEQTSSSWWTTSAIGQNRKSSLRAYNFRFASESGHHEARTPCPKRDISGIPYLNDRRRVFASGNQRHRPRMSIENLAGILPTSCKAWCKLMLPFAALGIRQPSAASHAQHRRRGLAYQSISRTAMGGIDAFAAYSTPRGAPGMSQTCQKATLRVHCGISFLALISPPTLSGPDSRSARGRVFRLPLGETVCPPLSIAQSGC